MRPELLSVGPVTLYSYGVLLATSYLLGLQYARVRARRRGLDADRLLDLGIAVIVAAIVGAKLLPLLADAGRLTASAHPLRTALQGPDSWYGGLLAAVLVGVPLLLRSASARRPQPALPLWRTCDAVAPAIALGEVTGRIGCFLAGCCYGTPTAGPWGVSVTSPLAAANVGTPLGVALHPVQLYAAGAALLVWLVLLAIEGTGGLGRVPGLVTGAFLLLDGAARAGLDSLRGDLHVRVAGDLRASQLAALLVAVAGAGLMGVLVQRTRNGKATA